MTRKIYSSFEQIDQELEILALEKARRLNLYVRSLAFPKFLLVTCYVLPSKKAPP